jgi:hypothetical protein
LKAGGGGGGGKSISLFFMWEGSTIAELVAHGKVEPLMFTQLLLYM